MKSIRRKQRNRDVLRSLWVRSQRKPVVNKRESKKTLELIAGKENSSIWVAHNEWMTKHGELGLNVRKYNKRSSSKHNKNKIWKESKGRNYKKKVFKNRVELVLPKEMDFKSNYESTMMVILAIRKFTDLYSRYKEDEMPSSLIKVSYICFDELKCISTSAALILTAEISRWNSAVLDRLTPRVENWDEHIYRQFSELGFFDLFKNKPVRNLKPKKGENSRQFVRYIKGTCGDRESTSEKRRELKREIANLVGVAIPKWTFLHSGISEAVTNVSHHAYPDNVQVSDKSWYLTGSFDQEKNSLKVAFYDQGIGIPKSLPASKIWEVVVAYLSKKQAHLEKYKDEMLIKAAVKVDRTSTGEDDRGKGLQDLEVFIRQIGHGHLTIMSYQGLYEFNIDGSGEEHIKTRNFDMPLQGTLIIWSVILNEEL